MTPVRGSRCRLGKLQENGLRYANPVVRRMASTAPKGCWARPEDVPNFVDFRRRPGDHQAALLG